MDEHLVVRQGNLAHPHQELVARSEPICKGGVEKVFEVYPVCRPAANKLVRRREEKNQCGANAMVSIGSHAGQIVTISSVNALRDS